MQRRDRFFVLTAGFLAFFLLSGFGLFKHKKYDTPITKDTLQPDKILFDRATKDIEHGNYEVARLTLNTLINTYDTSEYLAKAKLAIADSWYREGGAHGYSQAEAEYKDFILFYPQMEEAAQSQYKVCDIHYKQMQKADRDSAQAQRAEDECRQVMVQFPNSKYVPKAQQLLREVQEVLADKEYKTGEFYHNKGSFPAAASRLSYLTQQYPLYSNADDALWDLADAYKRMGDRFEGDEATALTKIVRDYPLSGYVDAAKDRLTALKRPVPEADPEAYAHMKYELENETHASIVHRAVSVVMGSPDTSAAAKSGAPVMTSIRPPVPASVPAVASGGATGVSDVTASTVSDPAALDQKPDARLGQPAATAGTGEQTASVGSNGQVLAAAAATPAAPGTAPPTNPLINQVSAQSLPTNHPMTIAQYKALKKLSDRAQKQAIKNANTAAKAAKKSGTTPAAATTPTAAAGTPAATGTPAPAPTATPAQ